MFNNKYELPNNDELYNFRKNLNPQRHFTKMTVLRAVFGSPVYEISHVPVGLFGFANAHALVNLILCPRVVNSKSNTYNLFLYRNLRGTVPPDIVKVIENYSDRKIAKKKKENERRLDSIIEQGMCVITMQRGW